MKLVKRTGHSSQHVSEWHKLSRTLSQWSWDLYNTYTSTSTPLIAN